MGRIAVCLTKCLINPGTESVLILPTCRKPTSAASRTIRFMARYFREHPSRGRHRVTRGADAQKAAFINDATKKSPLARALIREGRERSGLSFKSAPGLPHAFRRAAPDAPGGHAMRVSRSISSLCELQPAGEGQSLEQLRVYHR